MKSDNNHADDASLRAEASLKRDREPPSEGDRVAPPQAPSDDPVYPTEAVPIIKVDITPSPAARRRTAQRRAPREALPEKIPFGQTTSSSTTTPDPSADPEPEVTGSTLEVSPSIHVEDKGPAAGQPGLPPSVTSLRRKTGAPLKWVSSLGVWAASIAAVIGLTAYLLRRPPIDPRPANSRVYSPGALPEFQGLADAATAAGAGRDAKAQAGSGTSADRTAVPATVKRQRSTENRTGVRDYTAAERAQRRQTLDSLAAMGRREEASLHRGEAFEPSPGANRTEPARPAATSFSITKGLLTHWSFEDRNQEQATDDSPHGRHARFEGRPVPLADGVSGTAVRFDGRRDCLLVPDGTLAGKAGTISLWFRFGTAAWTEPLVSSTGNLARLRVFVFKGRLGAVFGPISQREPILADQTLKAGAWHHLALTWRSVGELALYLDGRPAARRGAGQLDDPSGVTIGKDPVIHQYAALDVDEVRLFDRALSDKEVAALAESAIP